MPLVEQSPEGESSLFFLIPCSTLSYFENMRKPQAGGGYVDYLLFILSILYQGLRTPIHL